MNIRARFVILRVVMVLLLAVLLFKLFDMQMIEGEQYQELSERRFSVNLVEKAPRGEIMDRYGTKLVTNRAGYSLQILKTDIGDSQFNEMLLKLLQILDEAEVEVADSFPVTEAPYQFDFVQEEGSDPKTKWFEDNKYKKKLNPAMTAEQVMKAYMDFYSVSANYTPKEARRIVGIRYEAEQQGFSIMSPFVIADEVSVEVVAKIKEQQDALPFIAVTNNYVREYVNDGVASHLLGRVGKMTQAEYDKYKEKGYSYGDIVGKQGVEKSAEQYLRGTDGTKGSEQTVNGSSVTLVEKTQTVPGNSVVLTIDAKLQKVAEDSLAKNIRQIQAAGGEKTGKDANAGAAVVVDVRNGDVLASASYPTFDLANFNEDYKELSQDKDRPLWNRAVSGTYTPGSTFKPLVSIAALESGKITTKEQIQDEGVYRFYQDYQPRCWIWQEHQTTHGKINVSKAIEQSCNYFFYETGRRCGIDLIDEYGKKFGLGEYTGIDLPEESKGSIASPASKKKAVKNVAEQGWFGGDTLQAAIGQSYHSFTPVQLANYAAVIANGGTRYKLNLIKSVRSSVDGSAVMETQPVVEDTVSISPQNLQAVREGMRNVVDEGSARSVLSGYPIKIGGKTGTAQLGKKASNNAVFVAFAPFDQPEIAVCVVLEHGVRGANAAYVAKDIFDQYFRLSGTQTGEEKPFETQQEGSPLAQ